VNQLAPNLTSVVWLSLQVSGTALILSAILGVPFGAWLGLAQFRGKQVLSAIIYTGTGFPPVVVGLLVYILLSRSGPLAGLECLFTPQAMILAQAIIAFPIVAGLVKGSDEAVPIELVRQVRSLSLFHPKTSSNAYRRNT